MYENNYLSYFTVKGHTLAKIMEKMAPRQLEEASQLQVCT